MIFPLKPSICKGFSMAMLNNQMVVSMVYRDESPVLGTSLEDDRQKKGAFGGPCFHRNSGRCCSTCFGEVHTRWWFPWLKCRRSFILATDETLVGNSGAKHFWKLVSHSRLHFHWLQSLRFSSHSQARGHTSSSSAASNTWDCCVAANEVCRTRWNPKMSMVYGILRSCVHIFPVQNSQF